MEKKTLAIAALMVIAAIGIGVGAVHITQTYIFPNKATVYKGSLTFALDSTPIANTSLIDWGDLNATETYYWNFTVTNMGNINCTVTLNIAGSPPGTITWTANNTLLHPGESVSGDLELIVADTPGSFTWDMHVIGKES